MLPLMNYLNYMYKTKVSAKESENKSVCERKLRTKVDAERKFALNIMLPLMNYLNYMYKRKG